VIAYFVTGTDTAVGKTTVSRALLAAATARGLRTRCCKPVESGCARAADRLIPHDAEALWMATDQVQSVESACVYRFEEPIAPGVAAERAGQSIDLVTIARHVCALGESTPALLLVEGAGGLLVPLGAGRTIADLALALSFPLLIVAHPGLGTINHTLLTIEAARARGLAIQGVIFSFADAEMTDAALVASNEAEIHKASGVPVLGHLPHLPAASLHELASAIESRPSLASLLPRFRPQRSAPTSIST
jgi:dethiobiotin synthetase